MTRKDTRDHRFKLGSSLEKLKTLNQSVKQRPDVILLIQNSPFSSLLHISECKMGQSAILIEKLLDKWDHVQKEFKFGELGVSVGAIEVTQILGIKGGETEVDLSKAGESIVWKFLKKTFPTETHCVYRTLLSHLNKEGEHILPDDYFRFYLAIAFTVFLFPSSGDKIKCRMLPYLDNVNELNKFNWSGAIQKSLMNALRECQIDQLNKKKKDLIFKGCSFFLQIWALEHTQVSICGVEESVFPLFLKYKNARFTKTDANNILVTKEVKSFLPDVSPAEGSSSPSAADGGLMDDEFVQTPGGPSAADGGLMDDEFVQTPGGSSAADGGLMDDEFVQTPRGLSTPFADEYGLEGKQKFQASPRIHVSDQDFSKVYSRGSKRLKYSYSLRTTVRGHLQLTDRQHSTENRLVGDVEHLLDSDYRTLSSCSTNNVMNKEEELLKKCKEKNVQHEGVVIESEKAIFQRIKELFKLRDKQQSSENRPCEALVKESEKVVENIKENNPEIAVLDIASQCPDNEVSCSHSTVEIPELELEARIIKLKKVIAGLKAAYHNKFMKKHQEGMVNPIHSSRI